jgi:hypothetical protein
VPPVGLDAVESEIGVLDEQVGIGAVARRQRDADAGGDVDALAGDVVGFADRIDDAGSQRLGLTGVVHVGLDDGEFVAAQARHQVGLAHATEQPSAHLLQQRIADRVAQRVVDALEAIEIEAQHGKALAAFQAQQRLLQPLPEQRAVRQLRQGVVARQMGDVALLAPALGDVLVERHPAAALERLRGHGDHALAAEFDGHGLGVAGLGREPIAPGRAVLAALFLAVVPERAMHRAGPRQLLRQGVHLGEALVAHQQARLGVEHAQAQRHGVDGGVELEIEPLELVLLVQKLERLGLEHRHRARQLPQLVLLREARDVDRGVVTRQPQQRPADALQPPQHASQEQEAHGADQQACDGGRAHPGDERPRARRDVEERRIEGLHALLALGGDVALQPLCRGRELGRRGARLLGKLQAGEAERQRALLLQRSEPIGEAVGRPIAHARHERCKFGRAVPVGALIALDGVVLAGKGCRLDEPALLLERGLRLLGEHHALQAVLADPAGNLFRAAGELNGGRAQEIDDRHREGYGAVELGGDLRPWQPQSFEHCKPAEPPLFRAKAFRPADWQVGASRCRWRWAQARARSEPVCL